MTNGHPEKLLTLCRQRIYVHNVLLGKQENTHDMCSAKNIVSIKIQNFTIKNSKKWTFSMFDISWGEIGGKVVSPPVLSSTIPL